MCKEGKKSSLGGFDDARAAEKLLVVEATDHVPGCYPAKEKVIDNKNNACKEDPGMDDLNKKIVDKRKELNILFKKFKQLVKDGKSNEKKTHELVKQLEQKMKEVEDLIYSDIIGNN